MKKTFTVEIEVEVEVDESKFTPEFMEAFNEYIAEWNSIEDHMRYIAKLAAQGVIYHNEEFLEGYGILKDRGIDFSLPSEPEVSESIY